MKIAVIGSGYVGLVTGACFSEFGYEVVCIDKDVNKIGLLKKNKIPIYEPGLEDLVKKNTSAKYLSFSNSLKSIKGSKIIFIAVGTPTANPFDDETYIVEVIDSNNCINYDTTFLKVESDVPTDAGGDTLTICSLTNVVLGGNPTAPAGSFYICIKYICK